MTSVTDLVTPGRISALGSTDPAVASRFGAFGYVAHSGIAISLVSFRLGRMKPISPSILQPTSRRAFLRASARTVAGTALLSAVARPGYAAEENTIRVALIGCGGRGTGAVANALGAQNGPIQLFAMADLFEDRLQNSYETLKNTARHRMEGTADSWVTGFDPGQVEVPPERRFLGFEAYREAMDALRPGDVAILTAPVAFRWVHFAYAIERGLHVFMEKPITVDGPTTRRMLALGEAASAKKLKVGVGLMCRHCAARQELSERIQSGQIGELTTLRTYRQVGPAGFVGPRAAQSNELLYQIRNYLGFFWASGGVFHDYIAHNIDECCWMKGAWPVRAQGQGGRLYRGAAVDQNFDNYTVEYTYPDGTKLFVCSRYMPGCHDEFASYALGTKGSAVISTFVHTPAKCRLFKGYQQSRPDLLWAFPQPEPNPYEREWKHLIDAIRQDQPFNEVARGAYASLTVALGRRAVHTGQVVEFEELLGSDEEFAPGVGTLTPGSVAPVRSGADGRYPTPQPGQLRDREYAT
jgi:predicted dehydrogenase